MEAALVKIFSNPLVFIASSLLIFLSVAALSKKHSQSAKPSNPRLQKLIDILLPYSRRIVFSLVLLWVLVVYFIAAYSYNDIEPGLSFMTRTYGLSALFMLFVVLSLGLTRVYFPNFALNRLLLRASRGFGLSTFLLAGLHAISGFVGNLDGNIGAFDFLSQRHQAALTLSSIALFVLFLMAITSVDKIIEWMTFRRWKVLHRFVYAATLAAVFHAFLIGSHFAEIAKPLPIIVMMAALVYLLLEAGAIYKKLQQNQQRYSTFALNFRMAGLILIVAAGMLGSVYGLSSTYDPHAGHRMDYSDAYQLTVNTTPVRFAANQSVTLELQVNHKATGAPVEDFLVTHEELMHLMMVSSDMSQYEHLHPDYLGGGRFSVSFTPLTEDEYFMYAEFLPKGDRDSLSRASIKTANFAGQAEVPDLAEDLSEQQTSHYKVRLEGPKVYEANKLHSLRFVIVDEVTGLPVNDLEPYLGAFGHLAAIHQDKETYLHVHPARDAKSSSERSGPEVSFDTIFTRPGVYRLYFQFHHDKELPVAAFTVGVL